MNVLTTSLPLGTTFVTWAEVVFFAPVLVLVFGGSLLLLLEVGNKSRNRAYMPWLTAGISVVAAFFALDSATTPVFLFKDAAVIDAFSIFITIIICVSVALSALLASDYLRGIGIERGEYYALLCFAASGMVMLAVSADLITLFVSLAVMSVSIYALLAYRRDCAKCSESAYKYLVLSGFSAAIFLYGASLLFAATGEMSFVALSKHASSPTPLFLIGSGLVTVGFAFKLAAVPFHLWAPDVYEGAPTPVVAFLAAAVKAAVFAALVRLLLMALGDPAVARTGFGWGHLVFVLCILSMVVGNVMALLQSNVKRMLGFSWIAHAGYVFLGVTAAAWSKPEVIDSVVIYLFAYGLSAIGAFAVISAVENYHRRLGREARGNIEEFNGLSQRSPGMAFAMAVFMLSLAGIPPTVGFFAKLEVLRVVFGAASADPAIAPWFYGLVIAGILTSAIGVAYYLRVVVAMYMRPETEYAQEKSDEGSESALLAARDFRLSSAMRTAVVIAVFGVIALGVMPGPLSGWAKQSVQYSFVQGPR